MNTMCHEYICWKRSRFWPARCCWGLGTGSGRVYGTAIVRSFMSKVGCLCILDETTQWWEHHVERNKLKPPLAFAQSVQVHSCFILISFFFSTQVSNRLSLSFDIKAAYMKWLICMVLGALKMDMIKNTRRQLVSDPCGHTEQGSWREVLGL